MTERTAIEWADSTFNPWIGCTKISPGCDHCYAEAEMDLRRHRVEWGAGKSRSRTAPANWALPLRWNAQPFCACWCGWRGEQREIIPEGICPGCGKAQPAFHAVRRRVFCASLADVFDNEVDPTWRAELFALIAATPNLDWLILTKRVGNAAAMMLQAIGAVNAEQMRAGEALSPFPLPNVWLGATIVNQAEADRDIPKLLEAPARMRFLSCEPLLGPIDLRQACAAYRRTDPDGVECCGVVRNLDWVIAGGESGPHARPMHPDWARSLRDQCTAADVPFLFKQWGEWAPIARVDGIHESPFCYDTESRRGFAKVGKKKSGRKLDGREHTEFPA